MILVQLPNISGDSQVTGYNGWIVADSISFSFRREAAPDAKTGTTGQLGIAELASIELTKGLDASSIHLLRESIAGSALKGQALIHLVEAGAEPEPLPYVELTLDQPVVKGWSVSGSEDERPTEDLSLLYTKIAMAYWTKDTKGGRTKVGVQGWDFVSNTAWTV